MGGSSFLELLKRTLDLRASVQNLKGFVSNRFSFLVNGKCLINIPDRTSSFDSNAHVDGTW